MRDRDSSVERLLPRTLEARAASAPTDACLDADTVAAWADNALTPSERAAAEAHAADCARCQALLAAMVTVTPAPLSTSRWRVPAAGWLIPLTAAAAAAILWVAVPRPAPQPPAPPAAEVAEAKHPTAATSADAQAAQSAPPLTLQRPTAAKDGSRDRGNTPRDASPGAPAAETKGHATAPGGSANAAAPQASAESIAPRRSADASAPLSAAPSIAPRTVPAPLKSEVRAFRTAARPLIASSDSAIRWRIVPGGNVERTSDGGSTWQTQETSATETLTAGASPSPSVCWLVGPHGIVLLSTDGHSWRRIPFPEEAALIGVSASDEQTATVAAADGREFSTSDGGRTWSRR